MNIVVIGAGGVGGFFGAKLAKAGNEVTFVVRGKHLEAIKTEGLQVKSIQGDFKVHPKVTDAIGSLQAPDLIILAVKSWQIDALAQEIIPILGPETMVLPLQNGADNADRLREQIPYKHVIAGLCKIISKIEAPGIIHHFGYDPEIVFGEYDDSRTQRMEALKAVFDAAQFNNVWSEHIQLDIWKKFLFIATVSGMGAITRVPFGVMREDENIRNLLYQTAYEIQAVALAKNIPLEDRHIEGALAMVDKMPYEATASMQRDFMEGRPSELDIFNGYIVRQGRLLEVPTPVNSFTYHCLVPTEKNVRKAL